MCRLPFGPSLGQACGESVASSSSRLRCGLLDSEVDDEDLLEGEGGESEEVVEGSMSEEPEAGGSSAESVGSLFTD